MSSVKVTITALLFILSCSLSHAIENREGKKYWVYIKPEYVSSSEEWKQVLVKLEQTGFKVFRISKWFNAISGTSSTETEQKIASFEEVLSMRNVNIFTKEKISPPHHKAVDIPTLTLPYGVNYAAYNLCGIPAVHALLDSVLPVGDKGKYGKGVRMALLDDGFSLRHEAFSHIDSSRILATRDYVRPLWDTSFTHGYDTIVEKEEGEAEGEGNHGTAVMSIIAGRYANKYFGVAPDVSLILAKTELTRICDGIICKEVEIIEEEDNWVAAVEWAVDTMHANIISSSLGYRKEFTDNRPDYPDSLLDGKTLMVTLAAEKAFEKGTIVITSIGNDWHRQPTTLGAPADGKNTIAVGAVDANGKLAYYSSSGPTYDGRIKPDILAPGHLAYCAWGENNAYSRLTGTSFAAPIVAGIAALAMQYSSITSTPITADSLIQRIRKSAFSPIDKDSLVSGWGYGIIDAYKTVCGKNRTTQFTYYDTGYIKFSVLPSPVRVSKELEFTVTTDNMLFADERIDTLRIIVYTLSGKTIQEFKIREAEVGPVTTIKWDLTSSTGARIVPGVYLYNSYFRGKKRNGKIAVIGN